MASGEDAGLSQIMNNKKIFKSNDGRKKEGPVLKYFKLDEEKIHYICTVQSQACLEK